MPEPNTEPWENLRAHMEVVQIKCSMKMHFIPLCQQIKLFINFVKVLQEMRTCTHMSTVYLLVFHVSECGKAGRNSKCMDQHCGNLKHRHLQMERLLLTVNLFHYYYNIKRK
jgi:hypothetical protein